MQNITTGNRQTLLDLAMQYAGSAEAALAMCLQNNLSITDELNAGTVLFSPVVINADIVTLFVSDKVQPASIYDVVVSGIDDGADTIIVAQNTLSNSITTGNRQTLLDLAMQYAGSAEAALAMCLQNNMPITQLLDAGTLLKQPVVVDATTVSQFTTDKVRPASILQNIDTIYNDGIGYWIIQSDFIVQ
jgi:hypothetical protein